MVSYLRRPYLRLIPQWELEIIQILHDWLHSCTDCCVWCWGQGVMCTLTWLALCIVQYWFWMNACACVNGTRLIIKKTNVHKLCSFSQFIFMVTMPLKGTVSVPLLKCAKWG
jgi:hypothetical protein